MEWSNEHDVLLCREILVVEPFKAKPRSSHRGQLWTKIAQTLNGLTEHKFSVTQRAVRDRFKKLKEHFLKKMAAEERGSGISPEESELDVLVEEILDLEKVHGEDHEQDSCERRRKELADKDSAEDMRLKAMETLRETQKRKAEAEGNPNERIPKRRSNGSEGFRYLQEKMENDREFREKELEMKKLELEREEKKGEREEKKHQDMMQMMQNQQQQMQQMQMSMIQAQAQQNQMFMALIEKLSK